MMDIDVTVSIKNEDEFKAYGMLEKTVNKSSKAGRVYTPITWVGKRIRIFLLDPLDEDEK